MKGKREEGGKKSAWVSLASLAIGDHLTRYSLLPLTYIIPSFSSS